MNRLRTSDILRELREDLACECTQILAVKCDADMIKVGTDFADVVARIAYFYDIDAADAAQKLNAAAQKGNSIISEAFAKDRYINIMLRDEYLLEIAHILIENYPYPESGSADERDYAIARADMMTRTNDDFFRMISDRDVRRAFIELLKSESDGGRAANRAFLRAESKMQSYNGMKIIADATARVLYKNGKEI